MLDTAIKEYRKRRAERLAARGIRPKQYRRSEGSVKISKKELQKNQIRMDAPEEEQEQNKNRGGGGGGGGEGHGNTRLPFGLCKRFGIDIGEGWGPREAWDALAGKGITPEGAFERLEKGEDPGTPEEGGDDGTEIKEPEPPKEPKKSITKDGKEFGDISMRRVSWDRSDPYRLSASDGEGHSLWASFPTKGDMMWYLKDAGVEEAEDPDTGELVNPMEMELPEKLFKSYSWDDRWYTEAGIGFRKGRYAVIGTGMDGKKRTITDYPTLERAKEYLTERGVPEDKIKLSPAMKKREAERTAWLTSDKKEYIERDGVRYGDLRVEDSDYGSFRLKASSEDGEDRISKRFQTQADLMKYLKDQGVERCKVGDEFVNPQEYEIPETVARIGDINYQKLRYGVNPNGRISLYGTDLDGREREISEHRSYESFGEFKARIFGHGDVDESIIEQDDEVKEVIRKLEEREAEEAKRKAEFEAKAITIDGVKRADLKMKVDSDGDYYITGCESDGKERRISPYRHDPGELSEWLDEKGIDYDQVEKGEEEKKALEEYKTRKEEFEKKAVTLGGSRCTDVKLHVDDDGDVYFTGKDMHGDTFVVDSWMDMREAEEKLERAGLKPEDIEMTDKAKEEYEAYKKRREEFEEKAMVIEGDWYADPTIEPTGYGSYYALKGYDERGRKRAIVEGTSGDIKRALEKAGTTIDAIPMSDEAKEMYDREKREEEGIASGEYKKYGSHVCKDFKIRKSDYDGSYYIWATDIDGKEGSFASDLSYDDAIEALESEGIDDYKIIDDKTGNEIKKPTYGMHKVMLMRKPDGGYFVYADTKRFGKHEIMYQSPNEEDARKWLRDNGVDEEHVKTRGMNPNDDVPRPHTARSLDNFDNHRMEREEDYPVLTRLSDAEKKEAVEMLTEVFNKGQYRMWRTGHFAEIVEDGFKNTLETGTSAGATGEYTRRETEEKTFGLKDHDATDGEKYGYLGHGDDLEAFHSSIARNYGRRYDDDTGERSDGFLYKFKKDGIKDRTTYVCGDTLDCRYDIEGPADRAIAGYAGDYPTYEGLSAMSSYDIERAMRQYRKYKEGKISYHDMLENISSECQDGYIECHFHDKLSIEDVESITTTRRQIKRAFDGMGERTKKKVLKKLKDNGIILNVTEDRDSDKYEDGYEFLRKEYGLE